MSDTSTDLLTRKKRPAVKYGRRAKSTASAASRGGIRASSVETGNVKSKRKRLDDISEEDSDHHRLTASDQSDDTETVLLGKKAAPIRKRRRSSSLPSISDHHVQSESTKPRSALAAKKSTKQIVSSQKTQRKKLRDSENPASLLDEQRALSKSMQSFSKESEDRGADKPKSDPFNLVQVEKKRTNAQLEGKDTLMNLAINSKKVGDGLVVPSVIAAFRVSHAMSSPRPLLSDKSNLPRLSRTGSLSDTEYAIGGAGGGGTSATLTQRLDSASIRNVVPPFVSQTPNGRVSAAKAGQSTFHRTSISNDKGSFGVFRDIDLSSTAKKQRLSVPVGQLIVDLPFPSIQSFSPGPEPEPVDDGDIIPKSKEMDSSIILETIEVRGGDQASDADDENESSENGVKDMELDIEPIAEEIAVPAHSSDCSVQPREDVVEINEDTVILSILSGSSSPNQHMTSPSPRTSRSTFSHPQSPLVASSSFDHLPSPQVAVESDVASFDASPPNRDDDDDDDETRSVQNESSIETESSVLLLPPRHAPRPIDPQLSTGPPIGEDDLAYAIRTQCALADRSLDEDKLGDDEVLRRSDKEVGKGMRVGFRIGGGTRKQQIMKEALICGEEDGSDELMIC